LRYTTIFFYTQNQLWQEKFIGDIGNMCWMLLETFRLGLKLSRWWMTIFYCMSVWAYMKYSSLPRRHIQTTSFSEDFREIFGCKCPSENWQAGRWKFRVGEGLDCFWRVSFIFIRQLNIIVNFWVGGVRSNFICCTGVRLTLIWWILFEKSQTLVFEKFGYKSK